VAAWNAGPTCFSIIFTSEPAYSTSTGPDPIAAGDGDALAEGPVAAADGLVAGADELADELLDEHAAADSPSNATPSTAAARLVDERKVSIPRR
jgi:hypothetical protein